MKPTLYLDLDGVLVDCDKKIFEIFHKPYDQLDREYLWGQISDHHPHFYRTLEPYKHTKKLYRDIQRMADNYYTIEILTATPRLTGHLKTAPSDKMWWVHTHLDPDITVNVVVGKEFKKFYLRSTNDVLIDDNQFNINDWNERHGDAIFFIDPASTLTQLQGFIDRRKQDGVPSSITSLL